MIYRLAVLWEFVSIVVCIHALYNRKMKLDIRTMGLFLVMLGVLELVLQFNLDSTATLCIFIGMVTYCILELEDNLFSATISTLLMLIVIGMLQFAFLLLFSFIGTKYEEWRMLIINILITLFSQWILPKMMIHKLREALERRDKLIVLIFFVALFVICMIIIEGKLQSEIHSAFFVFTIPVLAILLWTLSKWGMTQNEKELFQNELLMTKSMQEEYNNLLISVRLRQHGFKNHLAALLSIKYTSKSYEELVKAQDNYYGKIRDENRYNKLLFLGDGTIAGFLYEKFCQAEDEGVSIVYEIKGCFSISVVSIYHIIEMLGILFDNAIEAQTERAEIKRLMFQFEEQEMQYLFRVSNPHPYVNYAEIGSWFKQNISTKGSGHGLGLYHVKKLCEEYDANILCRNIEHEQENWIEMMLEIRKADKS